MTKSDAAASRLQPFDSVVAESAIDVLGEIGSRHQSHIQTGRDNTVAVDTSDLERQREELLDAAADIVAQIERIDRTKKLDATT